MFVRAALMAARNSHRIVGAATSRPRVDEDIDPYKFALHRRAACPHAAALTRLLCSTGR